MAHRIGIAGITGRMGKLLAEEVPAAGATLIGGIGRPGARRARSECSGGGLRCDYRLHPCLDGPGDRRHDGEVGQGVGAGFIRFVGRR